MRKISVGAMNWSLSWINLNFCQPRGCSRTKSASTLDKPCWPNIPRIKCTTEQRLLTTNTTKCMSILWIVVTSASKSLLLCFHDLQNIKILFHSLYQMFNNRMFLPQRCNICRVQIFGDQWEISASSHGRWSETENFKSWSPHECWGQCQVH